MQDAHTLRMQQKISAELRVALRFDAQVDMQRRVAFRADYLISSGLKRLILGISGGIDSCTAGRLAQLAVENVRAQGTQAEFIAMRLPYSQLLHKHSLLDVRFRACSTDFMEAVWLPQRLPARDKSPYPNRSE